MTVVNCYNYHTQHKVYVCAILFQELMICYVIKPSGSKLAFLLFHSGLRLLFCHLHVCSFYFSLLARSFKNVFVFRHEK